MLCYVYNSVLRKRLRITLDVTIGAQYLSVVQQFTVFSVIISDDLSWDSQSRKVRANISSRITAICRFDRSLNFNTCLTTFNAFICPHLNYCLLVWGNFSLSITKNMDMVLLRCARVIIHGQADIKLSSLKIKICNLCDFVTLVVMSNVMKPYFVNYIHRLVPVPFNLIHLLSLVSPLAISCTLTSSVLLIIMVTSLLVQEME